MRQASLSIALSLQLSCAAAPPAAPHAASHAPATGTVPPATPADRAPAALQKVFTGQAAPSLVVKNGMAIAQHVFIDWVERAVLAPNASQTFELPVGTHTVTCADSTDPDDHPAAVTEAFESGYAYAYELHASG